MNKEQVEFNNLKEEFDQYQKEYEESALTTLRSGWYILGNNVHSFENNFKEAINASFCVGVASGLDAIILGLRAFGIDAGDEVIVQSNAYIATVMGITQNNATPVFVEPDEFYNMDPNKIEEKITHKTKAILVTHLYGQSTRMEYIKVLCKKYQLLLFEDCAQSHFARNDGLYTGTIGDAGFFSFYPTKNLGAFGDGGAIITNDQGIDKKIRALRNYGSEEKYHNKYVGMNSRLDEIQAGFLNVKLKHIEEITNERREIANTYLQEIINPLVKLPKVAKKSTTVWHQFVIRVQHRDKFRNFLLKNGIKTEVHYPIPPHLSEAYHYLGHKEGDFPIAEAYAQTVVSLPIYNGLPLEKVKYVCEKINEYEE